MSRPLIGVTTSEVRLESRAEPLPDGDPRCAARWWRSPTASVPAP
jgi:hypothetical protein